MTQFLGIDELLSTNICRLSERSIRGKVLLQQQNKDKKLYFAAATDRFITVTQYSCYTVCLTNDFVGVRKTTTKLLML